MSYAVTVFLGLLMFGMGLGLTVGDFRRVVVLPRAALAGVAGQLLLLPLLGLALAWVLPLRPELKIGVVLIALCPGGALSNLFSYLARADLALSVTLTCISSLVTVFSIPILLNLALLLFAGAGSELLLPLLDTMAHIMMITVIPVSAGMLVRARWPRLAEAGQRWVKIGSAAFLPLVLAGILARDPQQFWANVLQGGAAAITLNVLALAMGSALGRGLRQPPARVKTLTIEIGAQNAMLGAAIAISPALLGNADIAIVPSIYGVTMVILLAFYVAGVRLRERRLPLAAGAPEAA